MLAIAPLVVLAQCAPQCTPAAPLPVEQPPPSSASPAAAAAWLDGQGDYIVGGHREYSTIDPVYLQSNALDVYLGDRADPHTFRMRMVIDLPCTLHVGTYDGLQRTVDQGSADPSFTVFGDGRGCNRTTSHVVIDRLDTDAAGAVSAFSLSFELVCEDVATPTNPALLRGSISYTASS
jgi:hypothetical protein